MFRNYSCLSLVGAVALTACTVVPEKTPQYTQNRVPTSYAQPLNASYQTTQSAANQQDCRRTETNRELIGGAVGGAVGAYAGKKIIGGTKGVVAGAALGGVAGYGIGDISTNCAQSAPAPTYSPAVQSNAGYQSAPAYSATAANYEQMRCPVGTKPHPSGTCLLDDSNANLQSATFTGNQTRTIERAQIPTRSQNVISASSAPFSAPLSAPAAPSAYQGVEATRTYNPQNYNENYSGNYSGNYRVVSGDTVYSLARKRCVPVSAIQSSNGLDASYGIQIGQSLNLPASQC